MTPYPIDDLLKKAVEYKASDVHLLVNEVPAFRINGNIIKTKLELLTEENIRSIIESIAPVDIKDKVLEARDYDFPYEIENISRFRINIAKAVGKHSITIRLVSSNIPTFEELSLPEKIAEFAKFENGIILVTGTAGSGKSTTIASILEYINATRKKHIITIEDPIEYVYKNKKSIFTQRQVGSDTNSFEDGIKYALRQDPNVVLIGEIRDMETVQSALNMAETGHLVFATLHTINAIQTFHRVLSFFPPLERDAVRQQFAQVFRGSISQRLIPAADKKSRACVVEILQTTPTIKDLFIKDELEEIYKLVQKGSYNNMITFNMSLYSLLMNRKITQETALEYSDNPNELQQMIRGVYNSISEDEYDF